MRCGGSGIQIRNFSALINRKIVVLMVNGNSLFLIGGKIDAEMYRSSCYYIPMGVIQYTNMNFQTRFISVII